MLPNFSKAELECQCGCGLAHFAPGFPQALQGLRDAMGEAIVLSSACRCKAHNLRPVYEGGAGGHPRSLHVGDYPYWPTGGTCAVDVKADEVKDRAFRAKLAELAWERGWSIGFHPKFLHLDGRSWYTSLPQTQFRY